MNLNYKKIIWSGNVPLKEIRTLRLFSLFLLGFFSAISPILWSTLWRQESKFLYELKQMQALDDKSNHPRIDHNHQNIIFDVSFLLSLVCLYGQPKTNPMELSLTFNINILTID